MLSRVVLQLTEVVLSINRALLGISQQLQLEGAIDQYPRIQRLET